MTDVLRGREFGIQRHMEGEGHMTEAEIKVMQLQAKEH